MPAIGSKQGSERGLQAAIRKPPPVKGIGPTAGKYGGVPPKPVETIGKGLQGPKIVQEARKAPPPVQFNIKGRQIQGLKWKGQDTRLALLPKEQKEEVIAKGKSLGGIRTPFSQSGLPGSHMTGVLPQGPVQFGATVLNKTAGAAGTSNLPGKLYNELLQIGMGGPRATVEAIEHPGKTAKGLLEVIKNPTEHPIGAALIFGGGLRAADRLAGKAGSTERAPGIVGGVDQTAVPRSYSPGLVAHGIQKGVEKAKEAAGVDPNILRTRTLPLYGSQMRKAIIGGITKPGLTDIHRGNTNIVADLQAAKGHEFIEANRPAVVLRDQKVLTRTQAKGDIGRAHDEAMMPFVEGYARHPDSYWEDISKREGSLLMERKGLTDQTALDRNQAQINQLRLVKEHQGSINKVGLPFHEAVARKLTDAQAHSFHQELLEGHLHPDQFNARLIGFGLEHGDLLGRGQLHYVKEPGKDPIIAKVGELKKSLRDAEKRTVTAKEKLAQAKGETAGAKRAYLPGTKAGVKVAQHHIDALDEAKAHEQDVRRQVQEGNKEIAHRKASGFMDHEGHQWQGLYDEHGQRVAGKDLRALYDQETKGRQPGFITHKEEGVPVVRGQYSGGTRPGAPARSRTGEHAMSGNYRNDFGVLHREFRRSARNLSAYRSENQLIEQFGIQEQALHGIDANVPPKAQEHQMIELARELNHSPSRRDQLTKRELGEWVVVSRGPERILSSHNIHDSRFSTMNQMGAAEGKAVLGKPGELKYTLIRKGVLERLEKHLAAEQPTSPIIKGMKQLTSYQRHTALYSSLRWPVGVTQENAIRLAAVNTSPLVTLTKGLAETSRAYKVGKGYLEGANKAAGDDLRNMQSDPGVSVPQKAFARTNAAMLEHGSMIGSEIRSMMNEGRSINQDLIDQAPPGFSDHVAGTVGIKQGLAIWNQWKQFVGNHLTNMENRTRIGIAGHLLMKEYGPFSQEIKGLIAQEDKIVKQVVANKLDPIEAVRFSQNLLDAAGNWSHLTPATREMRSWFAPFGLWWLNSVKFMFKTMPIDHPMKTALWAALVSATKPDERPEHKQGSIHANLPGLGPVDFSLIHYSTADIFHEWEKTAQSMVMPWFTQSLERAAGINPLYKQSIYNKEESEGAGPANVKAAAEETAESFLPFGNFLTSLARQGGIQKEKGSFPTLEAESGTKKGIPKVLAKFGTPVPFTYGKAEESQSGRTERIKPERAKAERGKTERIGPER